MKKIFTLLLCSLMTWGLQAQTTLWSESFDSSAAAGYTVTLGGEGSKVNATYGTTSDYFFRTAGLNFFFTGSSITMYAGNTGDFFAAQDIDDGGWTGSANPSELTWTGINITGYNSLMFEGDFASIATDKIDASDYVIVETNIDGAGWNKILEFRNDGTASNTEFLEDSDFDGIGDQYNLDSNMMHFSKSIAGAGSSMDVRIKISLNSGGEDMAFDEFSVTGIMPAVYQPTINSFTPADGASGVSATTDLTMTFDTAVVASTGNIRILNTTTPANNIIVAANSTDVSISNKTVTVSNLMLDYMSDYTILVDSDAFALSSGANSTGIYDNTRWNFMTMEKPDTLTSLSTTFANCNAIPGEAAGFTIINTTGPAKEWRCGIYGNGDSASAYMSGYNSGAIEVSEDYLISPAIKGSSATNYLHYYQKRRFSGDNVVDVLYSTDYDGQGMPQNANWTSIYTDNGNMDTAWTANNNLDLTAVSNTVFYIAFRYVADASTTGAFEWNIDDISMSSNPLSIKDVYTTGLNAEIIGNPVVNGTMNLSVDMDKTTDLQVNLQNIMGQQVLSTQFTAKTGNTLKQIDVSGITPGMYILQLIGEEKGAVIKVMID